MTHGDATCWTHAQGRTLRRWTIHPGGYGLERETLYLVAGRWGCLPHEPDAWRLTHWWVGEPLTFDVPRGLPIEALIEGLTQVQRDNISCMLHSWCGEPLEANRA